GGRTTGTIASNIAGIKTLSVRVTLDVRDYTLTQMPAVTFVAVGPGVPSAATSTLVAEPKMVAADGVAKTTLTLTVKDIAGNALAGQAATLPASGSDNTLAPAGGLTDASGRLLATLASRRAESKKVTATIAGVTVETTVAFVSGLPSPMTSTLT